ncbi:gliding motility protein GldN [Marinilabiliaceae bacterium JC017]|nr:gliding motility protein GldN [Marinilabiliaceae bacterium JC017]
MKKLFFILIVLLSFADNGEVNAQNVLDGLYPKEHVANRKPIPYAHIREADVLWAKKVWRIIDLREKINLPLYYPTRPMDDRFSLIDLLLSGIQYEGLTAYSANFEDEFKVTMTYEQVAGKMGAVADTSQIKNADTGLWETKIVGGEVRSEEVKQFLVKEMWFFDRNYSRMDVRIIGICPIREFIKDDGGEGRVLKKQVCWIYFNEARDLLARHEVFNPKNDAQRRTFDDIFIKRYFGSYIVRESNVYNNRNIETYTAGMEAMMESESIKNSIFTMEHDMWEF